ncbi:MAG: hypothetical protein HC831_08250 [Chloroflexia bacterium]|nr:hypothetical protein [Chloroflexia bacterium]
MSDLFDKIFVDRVNDVFTNHQESYHSNDWNKLQAKMNRSNRSVIVLWPHIAKAASVALFLGVAVFTANKYDNKLKVSDFRVNKVNEYQETNDNSAMENNNTTKNYNTFRYEKSHIENDEINLNYADKKNSKEALLTMNEDDSATYNNIGNEQFADVKTALQEHHNEIVKMEEKQPNSEKQESELKEYDDFIITNDKKTRKIDVGVELASVSNYSTEGTGNGVNFGGGIAAAYHITDKIRVTTGVLIAKQSIDYAPQNNYEMAYADYAELNSAYVADNQVVENVSSSASEVSFIAIDIPLNVQFKHNRVSFSTGFSSLLYVQEKYNRTYNAVVSNKTFNTETRSYDIHNSVETISKDETSEPFNRFDFARLLNISVGYDIPMAKGGITVEPYLKYPLGKISSREVTMGAGGIALRYIF